MPSTPPGAIITLYSKTLVGAVAQSILRSPLSAVRTPVIAQIDLGLAQSMQSLDAMLSTVGIGAGSIFGSTPPGMSGSGILI